MVIVDANVLVAFVHQVNEYEVARSVYLTDDDWQAPVIWRSELRSSTALLLRAGIVTLDTIPDAFALAEATVLDMPRSKTFSLDVVKLAYSSGCTAYDCECVQAAEDAHVPLVTWDKQLLKAFPEIAVAPEHFTK